MTTKYVNGSDGEAISLALTDETFMRRAMAFADVREMLLRELHQAETWHHEMRECFRCLSTSRLSAKEKNHPGYLSAWFSLHQFRVCLDFVGAGGKLTAELSAFEGRVAVYDNGLALHVPRVENRGYGCEHVDRLGFSWRASNPRFWQALALVRETSHPQLCGVCLCARVNSIGEACGCEEDDNVTMNFTASQ